MSRPPVPIEIWEFACDEPNPRRPTGFGQQGGFTKSSDTKNSRSSFARRAGSSCHGALNELVKHVIDNLRKDEEVLQSDFIHGWGTMSATGHSIGDLNNTIRVLSTIAANSLSCECCDGHCTDANRTSSARGNNVLDSLGNPIGVNARSLDMGAASKT